MEPAALVLARQPTKESGLGGRGLAGCLTQLHINQVPHGIRQADSVAGQLTLCQESGSVQKRERAECGMSFLSLATETLLQSRARVKLEVNLADTDQKVAVLSVGQFRVTAKGGDVKGTCKGIWVPFKKVYTANTPFILSLEIFENYVTIEIVTENLVERTRKLPCVIRVESDNFIVGSSSPETEGCIKNIVEDL